MGSFLFSKLAHFLEILYNIYVRDDFMDNSLNTSLNNIMNNPHHVSMHSSFTDALKDIYFSIYILNDKHRVIYDLNQMEYTLGSKQDMILKQLLFKNLSLFLKRLSRTAKLIYKK